MDINELVKYTEPVPQLPAEKQQVWNLIGRGKAVMDKALQNKALEIQTILKDYESMEIATLSESLAFYKKKHGEMVDYRKSFTRYLDAAIDQCMSYEKEYDSKKSELFIAASQREINLRKKIHENINAQNAKNNEVVLYKAHIENEYHSIVNKYRADLRQIIHDAYISCLHAKTPIDGVDKAISVAKSAMQMGKPIMMQKFNRTLITDKEALEYFTEIKKPDWPTIFSDLQKELNEKFSMYAHDLAAGENIIEQQNIEFSATQKKQEIETNTQVAANNLLAIASSANIVLDGVKPITEISKIKIKDNDQAWIVTIMSAFMSNFQKCFSLVRVKKYSALNVAQMAAALDAASIKVKGVEYEEIIK